MRRRCPATSANGGVAWGCMGSNNCFCRGPTLSSGGWRLPGVELLVSPHALEVHRVLRLQRPQSTAVRFCSSGHALVMLKARHTSSFAADAAAACEQATPVGTWGTAAWGRRWPRRRTPRWRPPPTAPPTGCAAAAPAAAAPPGRQRPRRPWRGGGRRRSTSPAAACCALPAARGSSCSWSQIMSERLHSLDWL